MIRSTFATLNLANRALVSQQLALDVTSHNIANANTDGFTRQAAEMQASVPFTVVGTTRPQQPAQLGTGVDVINIKRFRDGFLDMQYRNEQQVLGQWEANHAAVERLEQSLNEPSAEGLGASLSQFWNDWSALANNPESQAYRKALVESAGTLTNQMNNLKDAWRTQQSDLDRQIGLRVKDINNLTTRIARLNEEIVRVTGAGDQPNDLRDERDNLIDRLAKVVNIAYREGEDGAVTITIGGSTAVYAGHSVNLRVIQDPSDPAAFSQVVWEDAFGNPAGPVGITRGLIYGDMQARDVHVARALADLEELGETLVASVNEQHRLGYGLNGAAGGDFFEIVAAGQDAGDIEVVAAIVDDLDNIAAASEPNAPGDGSNALAIHRRQRELLMSNNSATIEDFYAGMVAEIGIVRQQAQGMEQNEILLISHLSQQRQSLGGVSIDEEATNLIRYQHAYNAAARVVTAFDEMLDRIINNMGIVGR
jgi:flagellar hook-associated protein 1 FlgK